jgi:predicted ArsR family transcriptional regulator
MMATALSGGHKRDGAAALQEVAADVGNRLGSAIRARARTKQGRREAVQRELAQLGFEPQLQDSGDLVLRNCIFADLSASHRELVCGMNAALVEGMLSGAHLRSLHVEGRTVQPSCCVRIVGR